MTSPLGTGAFEKMSYHQDTFPSAQITKPLCSFSSRWPGATVCTTQCLGALPGCLGVWLPTTCKQGTLVWRGCWRGRLPSSPPSSSWPLVRIALWLQSELFHTNTPLSEECKLHLATAGYELNGVPLVSYGATSFLAPVWALYQVGVRRGQACGSLVENGGRLV